MSGGIQRNRSEFQGCPPLSIHAVSPSRRPCVGGLCWEKAAGGLPPGEKRFPQLPPCTVSSDPTNTNKIVLCPVLKTASCPRGPRCPGPEITLSHPPGPHDPAGRRSVPGWCPALRQPGPQPGGGGQRSFPLGQQAGGECVGLAARAGLGQGGELADPSENPKQLHGFAMLVLSASSRSHTVLGFSVSGLPSWRRQSGPHLSRDTAAVSATCRSPGQALGFFRDPGTPWWWGKVVARPHLALRTKPVQPGSMPA